MCHAAPFSLTGSWPLGDAAVLQEAGIRFRWTKKSDEEFQPDLLLPLWLWPVKVRSAKLELLRRVLRNRDRAIWNVVKGKNRGSDRCRTQTGEADPQSNKA
jgi:hypothetical protein